MSPRSLFKYCSIDNFTLEAIKTGCVWMSNPANFNDPFDCALSLDFKSFNKRNSNYYSALSSVLAGRSESHTLAKQQAPIPGWVMNVANHNFLEEQRKIGVCCFSEESTNILMWSHYADNHRGICIEYEFSEGTLPHSKIQKVNYCNQIPQITVENFNQSTREEKQSMLKELSILKSEIWGYEKEWRLIHDENDTYFPEVINIKSVILGIKISHEDRAIIINLLKDNDRLGYVKVKNMSRTDESFLLEVIG